MGLFRSKLITFNPSCLIKCFLWSLLLILQGCCPFPGSDGSCTKGHYRPKIEKNTTLYNLRMEMIRRDLVEKMGLQEAKSKDTHTNHIPDAILKEFWAETERYDERERTESSRQVKKLMVHAKKVTDSNCHGCIRFTDSIHINGNNISYFNLIVYTESNEERESHNITLQVYNIEHRTPHTEHRTSNTEHRASNTEHTSKRLIVRRDVNTERSGWLNFKITDVGQWITSKKDGTFELDLLLQLICTHCHIRLNEDNMPILSVTAAVEESKQKEETGISKRRRRSAMCSGKNAGTCCRDTFHVRFKDVIGEAEKRLILPEGLDIGQCRGKCGGWHILAKEYSAIIQALKDKSHGYHNLCCVPVRYEPTTVLVSDTEDGAVYKKKIYGLVVSECGCL